MEGSLCVCLYLCVCVSVGWCQYLTGWREILKLDVRRGPYLHPDFLILRTLLPPNGGIQPLHAPKSYKCTKTGWNVLFAFVCLCVRGNLWLLNDGVTLRESVDFSENRVLSAFARR